jgi:hypothetical protein
VTETEIVCPKKRSDYFGFLIPVIEFGHTILQGVINAILKEKPVSDIADDGVQHPNAGCGY